MDATILAESLSSLSGEARKWKQIGESPLRLSLDTFRAGPPDGRFSVEGVGAIGLIERVGRFILSLPAEESPSLPWPMLNDLQTAPVAAGIIIIVWVDRRWPEAGIDVRRPDQNSILIPTVFDAADKALRLLERLLVAEQEPSLAAEPVASRASVAIDALAIAGAVADAVIARSPEIGIALVAELHKAHMGEKLIPRRAHPPIPAARVARSSKEIATLLEWHAGDLHRKEREMAIERGDAPAIAIETADAKVEAFKQLGAVAIRRMLAAASLLSEAEACEAGSDAQAFRKTIDYARKILGWERSGPSTSRRVSGDQGGALMGTKSMHIDKHRKGSQQSEIRPSHFCINCGTTPTSAPDAFCDYCSESLTSSERRSLKQSDGKVIPRWKEVGITADQLADSRQWLIDNPGVYTDGR